MSWLLSKSEIGSRLIRLRNLERLHEEQKQVNEKLRAENKTLKEEMSVLRSENEALRMELEDLKTKLFGRKRNDDASGTLLIGTPKKRKHRRAKRSSTSYRRAVPETITDTQTHTIETCPTCNTPLTRITDVIQYVEDIILPTLTESLRTCTKHIIQKGWCKTCRAWKSAIPISTQVVTLGRNIKQFIVYAITLLRLSFEQTRILLVTTFGISLSDGEIGYILDEQGRSLRPAYEAMATRIRGQPGAHYDETPYYVQTIDSTLYAWVMTGTEDDEMVFIFGRSRGKDNAKELKGDSNHIGITDDYGSYTNLFAVHALCWAHPHRKIRDLARSSVLPKQKHEHCQDVYADFSALYAKIRRASKMEPFNLTVRKRLATRYMKEFMAVTEPHSADPKKLATIKRSLQGEAEKYFVCILYEGIPPDNNKAERSLRHMVLKRRMSHGSKTEKGAKAMEVVMSIVLSLWKKHPDEQFFPEYQKLLQGA